MATRAVLLSGEHAGLPAAELRALLDVHDPQALVVVRDLIALVEPHDEAGCDAALARMALAHEWGELWAQDEDNEAGHERLTQAVARAASGVGRAAVTSERRGDTKSPHSQIVQRRFGTALGAKGHVIDLRDPEVVIFAWLIDGIVLVGLRRGVQDRSRFEARISDKRAHFSPVSLHPRRAASLLHLARVTPGGRVYDPFCGTGGFVLEAVLEGYDAWGSDLDPWMVQGTWQALTDVPPEPLEATVFEADIAQAPELAGIVDGIVTDLPYGRASSTDGEGLQGLYERAFAAFAQLLPPGAYAVVGHPDPRLLDSIQAHGFAIVERHEERAHRSLTRHFAVVKRMENLAVSS